MTSFTVWLLPRHVLKTNFYQSTKVALSFRLTPEFLPEVEYPKTPFGVFFVIGNDFRGFHIRFRDVARGGIRLVMSRNREWVIRDLSLVDTEQGVEITLSTSVCCLTKTTTWLQPSRSRIRIYQKEEPRVLFYLRSVLVQGAALRNMLMWALIR